MAIDLTNFWDETDKAPPPLTDKFIEQAEQQLGVHLPADLLALLKQQNGGYTRGFVFPTAHPTSWGEGHVPFDELYGLVPSDEGAMSILDTRRTSPKNGACRRNKCCSVGTAIGLSHWIIATAQSHK